MEGLGWAGLAGEGLVVYVLQMNGVVERLVSASSQTVQLLIGDCRANHGRRFRNERGNPLP